MQKDTSFNIGPDNIAIYIKVDPDELPLRERERGITFK